MCLIQPYLQLPIGSHANNYRTMDDDMISSRVFDTLLLHFGGTEEDEMDIDPTMIEAVPISESQILSTSYSSHIDLKKGFGVSTTSLLGTGSCRRVSSSSATHKNNSDKSARHNNDTGAPTPSIFANIDMLCGGISNEMASNNVSHHNSAYNFPPLGIVSGSRQQDSWLTSTSISTHANNDANQTCLMNYSENSTASHALQSMVTDTTCVNVAKWAGGMDTSMMMNSSNSSNSTLNLAANFSFLAPSIVPSGNSKAVMIDAWSDASAILLGDLATSMQTTVSNNRQRRKHDASKPKRPLSAYNIFFKEERQRILDELPPEILKHEIEYKTSGRRRKQLSAKELLHSKVDFHHLAKMVGRRWRKLPTSELEKYKSIANADFQRYKKEISAYKASMLLKKTGKEVVTANQDNAESLIQWQEL